MKFWRNEQIECLAESRLDELESIIQKPVSPPVPIELLAEKFLKLDVLCEGIEELHGETVLGGIRSEDHLILLNEKHKALFDRNRDWSVLPQATKWGIGIYSSTSMPRKLIREAALKLDRTKWPNLYMLAETFDVTITALRIRLEQLDLLYVQDKTLNSTTPINVLLRDRAWAYRRLSSPVLPSEFWFVAGFDGIEA